MSVFENCFVGGRCSDSYFLVLVAAYLVAILAQVFYYHFVGQIDHSDSDGQFGYGVRSHIGAL